MASRASSKRYAQAAFEIASETGELERWQSDLERMVKTVKDEDIRAFLESPKVHFEAKSKLLSAHIKEINPLVRNLVLMLISRGRLDIIGEIADEYRRLWKSSQGIEVAEVTTAVPLAREDEQRLAKQLRRVLGKKIEIKSDINPGIIGGFTARIGDRLLDGSVRGKLAALKKELAGAGR